MAINLHQLKIFHTVAKTGSFSRAAAELMISQPSVSIQVGDLERQFGVDLFEQAGKSVRLTEAGRVLDDYAGQILTLIDDTRRAMDEVRGMRRGRLLIGATQTPGTYQLPKMLGRLKTQYPHLEIALRIAGTRRIQEMLLRREIDVGVVGGRVTFPDLEAVPIATDELVLVTAPEHKFAALPSVRVADLSGEPFILRERGSGTRETLDDALHRVGIHITPSLELEGIETVKQSVAANLGVSILSRDAVAQDVAAGTLRIIPVDELAILREILLVYPKDRRLPPIARAFVDLVTPPREAVISQDTARSSASSRAHRR
jgi:DNA-binding transcriptional LysR family regulator